MTKRQWRRYRGKIIAKNSGLAGLRRVRFTSMVMIQIVEAFIE
jgi:hypothetical protein